VLESRLIKTAADVRARAHSPYSRFPVGAALATKSGKIYQGCNIENVSLRLTICAEQGAVAAAVAAGDVEFVSIAVVADSKEPVMPCGACRQMLAEFNPSMTIISSTLDGRTQSCSLNDLLPQPTRGILDSLKNV
jgi:cytidine deaminase